MDNNLTTPGEFWRFAQLKKDGTYTRMKITIAMCRYVDTSEVIPIFLMLLKHKYLELSNQNPLGCKRFDTYTIKNIWPIQIGLKDLSILMTTK